MNDQAKQHDRLLELAAAQCDGTLSEVEHAELAASLAGSVAAQRQYLRYVALHAELACSEPVLRAAGMRDASDRIDQLAHESEREAEAARTPRLTVEPSGRWWPLAVAAALVMMPLLIPLALVGGNWERIAGEPALATVRQPGQGLRWATGEPVADDDRLRVGTYHLQGGEAQLTLGEAVEVALSGPSVLRLAAADRVSLLEGQLRAAVGPGGEGFEVHTPTVRIVDLGTEFEVDVEPAGRTDVRVLEGAVQVYAPQPAPRVYVDFDQPEGEIRDLVTGAEVTLMGEAALGTGLIGEGAAELDGADWNGVYLGNGGGWEIGTGAFSASTGVSVEALIVPRWSGEKAKGPKDFDQDLIFRKDDRKYRMLLGFQHDDGMDRRTVPAIERGPTLTWGLYLEGDGYSEMEMPLDGREGRPTFDELRDGQWHHVVATYDAATGEKAIYIDGVKRFSHHFEPGLRVISGGAAPAMVGNVYASKGHGFKGLIDGFAFYDTALSAQQVASHYANARLGGSYYGPATTEADLAAGRAVRIIEMEAGETRVFE